MSDFIKSEALIYKYSEADVEASTGREAALRGIDLEIPAGSFTAIVGPNGSGKSTFARHLNALLVPTEGRVFVDGMDTSDEANLLPVREKAGMVFQNPDSQIIGGTVEEDAAFGPENLGIPSREIRKRVRESLRDLGVSKYAKKSPNTLSGGEKMRVTIAGILAMDPECLILDEPTAMLDPEGRASVMEAITQLNKERHTTVILVTHFMEEAALADRIIVMDKGKIAADGSPEEIFSDVEWIRSLGLSIPPAAEIAEKLRAGGMPLSKGIYSEKGLTEAIEEVWN
ncbi:MAG: energy-coupling factor transporter ATPase [Lachnospiraceae bacterium]|nr:energy-coupling factor transporter ATPase [Lachnospiraceae bacterium]